MVHWAPPPRLKWQSIYEKEKLWNPNFRESNRKPLSFLRRNGNFRSSRKKKLLSIMMPMPMSWRPFLCHCGEGKKKELWLKSRHLILFQIRQKGSQSKDGDWCNLWKWFIWNQNNVLGMVCRVKERSIWLWRQSIKSWTSICYRKDL